MQLYVKSQFTPLLFQELSPLDGRWIINIFEFARQKCSTNGDVLRARYPSWQVCSQKVCNVPVIIKLFLTRAFSSEDRIRGKIGLDRSRPAQTGPDREGL